MLKVVLTAPDKILKLIAALCILAVCFALFSQHYMGMRPCAWCVLQRLILIVIAVVSLLASNQKLPLIIKQVLAGITALASIAGIIAAWYQYSVAAQMFSCAQTFADKFITASGLDVYIPWLFGVYATCMDARVDLLGIEYALWGLILFVICTLLAVLSIICRRNHSA